MKHLIEGDEFFWAVLCYCSEGDPMICGVYPSKEEAEKVAEEIKGCVAKHKIKKCKVKILLT
jgi:hypothetical protein